MATAKKKRGRPASKKAASKAPPRLPGTEDAAITEIQNAMIAYVEHRDERMAMTKPEGELKDKLIKAMQKHKRSRYVYQGRVVEIEETPGTVNVTVRKLKEAKADE